MWVCASKGTVNLLGREGMLDVWNRYRCHAAAAASIIGLRCTRQSLLSYDSLSIATAAPLSVAPSSAIAGNRGQLWPTPRSDSYEQHRGVTAMNNIEEWQLWTTSRSDSYDQHRGVTAMNNIEEWQLWTPSRVTAMNNIESNSYEHDRGVTAMNNIEEWQLWTTSRSDSYKQHRGVTAMNNIESNSYGQHRE